MRARLSPPRACPLCVAVQVTLLVAQPAACDGACTAVGVASLVFVLAFVAFLIVDLATFRARHLSRAIVFKAAPRASQLRDVTDHWMWIRGQMRLTLWGARLMLTRAEHGKDKYVPAAAEDGALDDAWSGEAKQAEATCGARTSGQRSRVAPEEAPLAAAAPVRKLALKQNKKDSKVFSEAFETVEEAGGHYAEKPLPKPDVVKRYKEIRKKDTVPVKIGSLAAEYQQISDDEDDARVQKKEDWYNMMIQSGQMALTVPRDPDSDTDSDSD